MEFLSREFSTNSPQALFVVPCIDCVSMDDLFELMCEKLLFPDYFWFGNRWDSLVDCLMDLSWIEADNITIYFSGFELMCVNLGSSESDEFIHTIQFIVNNSHLRKPKHKHLRIIID